MWETCRRRVGRIVPFKQRKLSTVGESDRYALSKSNNLLFLDQENQLLLDLVDTLSKAKESSEKFASTMKRARKRSTDAKRAMVMSTTLTGTRPREDVRFDISLQKKIELAQAELRHLDSVRFSLGQAETVISLQDTSTKLSDELGVATRRLRQLRTENSRREKELEKLVKSPLDHTRMEDSLRRELYSVRARNTVLQRSIESNEGSLSSCLGIERKLRAELESLKIETTSSRSALAKTVRSEDSLTERQAVLEQEIQGLKAEKTQLETKLETMRECNSSKLTELELVVKSIRESRKECDQVENTPVVSPRTIVIEATPIQVSPPAMMVTALVESLEDLEIMGTEVRQLDLAEDCPELEAGLAHGSSLAVSMIEPFSLPVSPNGLECHTQFIPVEQATIDVAENVFPDETEIVLLQEKDTEELEVPELHFDVQTSISSQLSEKFIKVSEEGQTEELVPILPRRLFQSTAVTQEDSNLLGERVASPAPPLINVPRVFLVSSRSSSWAALN